MINVISAVFRGAQSTTTRNAYQYDYGQVLKTNLALPETYEVQFSNNSSGGVAITQIGNADGVTIPDQMFISGAPIYAWIFLHQGADDGETVYFITIPVTKRAKPTSKQPTPAQKDAITQAIAALNAAVEQTGQDVEDANNAAESARESADAFEGMIAEEYDENKTYTIGDYSIHNDVLYRCTTAIPTAEAWTAAHWTAAVLGDDASELKSAVSDIEDEIYYFTPRTETTSATGWRLNESDGLCSSESGYQLTKYAVTAGDIVKVVSDDRFQFQTVASVPSYGTNNRVGVTYGAGTFILTVPETATYLIVSTPTTSNASVYATETIKSQIDEAFNAINIQTGWKNSYDETIPVNAFVRFPIYATEDDIIMITPSVVNSGIRASFYYGDGTSKTTVEVFNGLIYRPEKGLVEIGIYNGYNSNITVSIKKTNNPLNLANYYDKAAKISGYINSGNVETGYYHSDYIPYHLGEKIIASGYPSTFGPVRFHFYNPEKTYIGRITATLREDGLYEVSTSLSSIGDSFNCANVAYVNFNMTVAGADTAVCYINNVPDTPLEYGQVQPESALFFNAQQKSYISSNGSVQISGKKIAYNGDSIAETRLTAGNTYNGGAYPKMIADITGGTYSNISHGGGILASAVPEGTMPHSILSTLSSMPDDADLICFEGGINDYWRDVPLGDYSESDYSATLDTTTVCGALESIFRQATQKWVGKPICFVIVHKIKSTVYVANSAGWTFAQGREKMIGICKKYAIPFYDAFAESGLNAYNDIQNTNFLTSNSSGMPDGCHPNEAGYKKYYVPQLIALFNKIMPRS